MSTPKTETSKDIVTVNRVVVALTPILCFDEESTQFIKERIHRQLSEIKDIGLSYAAHFFYYFTMDELDKGFEYAEKAINAMPNDLVTWRHYSLCVFWRCGAVKALEVIKRALPATHSGTLALEGCFYSLNIADFNCFLEMHGFLVKTQQIDSLMNARNNQDEDRDMARGLENAALVKRYGKAEELRALAALMYEKIPLQNQLSLANQLIDVSDEDESALLYELHIEGGDADKCAAMNVSLISERIKVGLTDWSVSGIFVSKEKERE